MQSKKSSSKVRAKSEQNPSRIENNLCSDCARTPRTMFRLCSDYSDCPRTVLGVHSDYVGEGKVLTKTGKSSHIIHLANNCLGAKSLGESDLNLLRTYTLKVEDHLSEHTFNRLSKVFPNNSHDTLKATKKCVRFLSGFLPVWYSCCISSSVCFVGPYEDLTKCPNCQEA